MSPFYGVRLKKARPTHVSTAYLGLRGPPCKGGGNSRSAERRIEGLLSGRLRAQALLSTRTAASIRSSSRAGGVPRVIERSSIALSGSSLMDFTEADDPIAL